MIDPKNDPLFASLLIEDRRRRSDPPQDRYLRDSQFKCLVDYIEAMIRQCDFTPTEVREAAMLASIRHEQTTLRRYYTDRHST